MRHIVAICCFCEKVRDDIGTESGQGLWQDFASYMGRHVLKPAEVMFTHTYCPACLSYYREFLGVPAGTGERNKWEGGA